MLHFLSDQNMNWGVLGCTASFRGVWLDGIPLILPFGCFHVFYSVFLFYFVSGEQTKIPVLKEFEALF